MEDYYMTITILTTLIGAILFMIYPIALRAGNKRPLEPREAKGKMIAYVLIMFFGFNTISILMGWGVYLGGLGLVILGIIAYNTILLRGSFAKSFNGLMTPLQAEIMRAEKVIKSAWENHHTDLDKRAIRQVKNFEPSEQLYQRYAVWIKAEEAAMDRQTLEEGYYLLEGLHKGKDYLEAYYVAQKLIRADLMKKGDWTAVNQVKTIGIYKELLPTEKDFVLGQNINERYVEFLNKETANFGEKDMRQASSILWYYTETNYRDLEKADRVAQRMLEANHLHPAQEEQLKELKQLSIIKKAFEADMKNQIPLKDKPNINIQLLEGEIEKWEKAISADISAQMLKKGGYILSHAMRFGQLAAAYRVASRLLALYENAARARGITTPQSRSAQGEIFAGEGFIAPAAAAAGSQIGGGHANQEQADTSVIGGQNAAAEAVQAPQVQFCRMCGTKLPMDSVFCKQCGTKII